MATSASGGGSTALSSPEAALPAPGSFTSRGRRIAMLLATLLLVGCGLQDTLLYFPDRRVPSERELAATGLRFWPSGKTGYRGFVGREPGGSPKGTVIVLHGNAATAADRDYYLAPLQALGYRVILAEYPGYGGRTGKPGEDAFFRDARETIRLAREQYGGPLYLIGESLGAAVAASSVREPGAGVGGLVLVTPWARLEEVARELYPLLPVRLFMTDPYDTARNLKEYPGPVAIVAAERDEIVSPRHARRLYDSIRGRKRLWSVPGAGHNDWPASMTGATWSEIMTFLQTGS